MLSTISSGYTSITVPSTTSPEWIVLNDSGEVVEGTVIDVKPEEIVLNIGYKSDGVLTRNE